MFYIQQRVFAAAARHYYPDSTCGTQSYLKTHEKGGGGERGKYHFNKLISAAYTRP